MWYRKIIVALLAGFLLFLNGSPQFVSAHADLIQSVPEANAILDDPPPQVELFFSETIKPGFSSIQVLDGSGIEVQVGEVRSDPAIPNHLFVAVRSLPDGIYTVSWRTLSAVDGHVSAGVFPFAVGEVLAEELTAVSLQPPSSNSSIETAVRLFIYLAAMSLTGGFLFLWQVWQPAVDAAQWQPKEKIAWRSLAIWALLILGSANLIWLLAQAGAIDDRAITGRLLAMPWDDSIRRVLFITRFGSLWVARFLLLLILLGLVLQPQTKRHQQISTVVGILLLMTISLGSHAAAQSKPLLPIIGDVLHISAAAFWFGGLLYFVVGMVTIRAGKKETKPRTQFTAILIKRFSNMAILCMAIILLSGVYASVLQLGAWSALWLTAYGLTLSVKLLFFVLILGFAAFNLFKMSPAMSSGGNKQLLNRFFKLIRNEALLATAVILSVAVLTVLPTPNNSASIPTVSQSSQQADLDVQLDVVPGRVGLNKFSVRVQENGRLLTTAKEVALNFFAKTSDLPINQVDLLLAEDGSYSVRGGYLSLPDLWDVEVVVRRDGALDEFVPYELDLQETAVIQPPFPWYRATGGLFVAAAVAYLFALTPIFKKPVQTVGLVYAPATVLVFLGFLALISDPPADVVATQVFILNPIAADVDSVAVGGILYSENCEMCHGATGVGDGPVGLTLDPPPANLQVHATSGVHPDGELFLWISEGVEYNPVMPAFEDKLDAEERWHLVNFMRTLAN